MLIAAGASAFTLAVVIGFWTQRPEPQVEIIATAADIPAGVTITDTMVFAQHVHTDADPAQFASRSLIESGAITNLPLPAGHVLLRSDVAPADPGVTDPARAGSGRFHGQFGIAAAMGIVASVGLVVFGARRRRTPTAQRGTPTEVPDAPADSLGEPEGSRHLYDLADRSEIVRAALDTVSAAVRAGNQRIVRAVELAGDGIEILWTTPQPQPPRHWSTNNGGWTWCGPVPKHRLRQQTALPTTIVSLGFRADRELFACLGTAPTVTIHGPRAHVTAYTRHVASACRASPTLDDNARVVIIARPDDPSTANSMTPETTFAFSDSTGTSCEPHPVSPSRSATANAVTVNATDAGEYIVIHGAHRATWVSAGIEFDPCLADPTEPSQRESDLSCEPITAGGLPGHHHDVGDAAACATGRPYDVLVRVLGEVTVERHGPRLTDAETELLVLLAALKRDGPVNVDRLATMLAHDDWRTPKIRSVQARISNLRRKLGAGTDGASLLPDSRTSAGGPSRYQLSTRVVTDVELIEQAHQATDYLTSSQARNLLRENLKLIRGKPYTARTGYSWAYDEHAAHDAVQSITRAADRFIELCAESNDTEAADWTRRQLTRALD
ncbi:MAG: hypothetical protein AB7N61_23500 [Acidimicrobiia bacterium]